MACSDDVGIALTIPPLPLAVWPAGLVRIGIGQSLLAPSTPETTGGDAVTNKPTPPGFTFVIRRHAAALPGAPTPRRVQRSGPDGAPGRRERWWEVPCRTEGIFVGQGLE
jgi:hypothetical protein